MTILSATMLLFLLMDPVGAVPVFASLLRSVPAGRRSWVIVRENLVALGTLTFFLFFGSTLLRWMHIGQPALSIAGGLVLIIVALEMIFPGRGKGVNAETEDEPFIVPLAIPLIAGPSTMAMIMLMATQHPDHRLDWLVALAVAWAAGVCVLLLSVRLQTWLGRRGLAAIERLMGMILVVVAVQMALSGVEQFLGR